jgi:hypothetical protein
MNKIRCAIYTRKSSEEGLEQGFNSLDAQREACAAYVLSQASEGWHLLPDVYDDGGISGGTLERPALQRLLADVAAGKIDIIVAYKVDRLTRSLLDFAKLVEAFDKAEVSFVSITQSFNTTTSMGARRSTCCYRSPSSSARLPPSACLEARRSLSVLHQQVLRAEGQRLASADPSAGARDREPRHRAGRTGVR